MNNTDIFFKRTNEKDYHEIFVTSTDFKPLAIKHEKHTTADKIMAICEKKDDATPLLRDDCLVIRLEKNYSFTNYQAVLNTQTRLLTDENHTRLLEVIAWILETYPEKIKDAEQAQLLCKNQEERDRYLTNLEIKSKADYLYQNQQRIYINQKLDDLTCLLDRQFPDINWGSKDTENLSESLMIKFNYFIENENSGWVEEDDLKTIEEDYTEEVYVEGLPMGESSGKKIERLYVRSSVTSGEERENEEKPQKASVAA